MRETRDALAGHANCGVAATSSVICIKEKIDRTVIVLVVIIAVGVDARARRRQRFEHSLARAEHIGTCAVQQQRHAENGDKSDHLSIASSFGRARRLCWKTDQNVHFRRRRERLRVLAAGDCGGIGVVVVCAEAALPVLLCARRERSSLAMPSQLDSSCTMCTRVFVTKFGNVAMQKKRKMSYCAPW